VSTTQAILSGILQGVTEFFPISSSGHLVILHKFFGINQPQVLFDVFLHIGTLFAVLIYLRKELKNILFSDRRLGFLVLMGCVPIFVAGFLFAGFIEEAFSNVKAVAIYLLITGAWLFLGQAVMSFPRKRESKDGTSLDPRFHGDDKRVCREVTWREALAVGCAQAAALLPGISRSGATISTGLMCGLDRQSAFRYSFLLLIPATLGALGFKLLETGSTSSPALAAIITGTLAAFLIGLISLKILHAVLTKGKLYIFGIYCIILSGALLI